MAKKLPSQKTFQVTLTYGALEPRQYVVSGWTEGDATLEAKKLYEEEYGPIRLFGDPVEIQVVEI